MNSYNNLMINLSRPANEKAFNPLITTSAKPNNIIDNPRSNQIIKVNQQDDEKVDMRYIIKNKPSTKVVREYMRFQLKNIPSEEAVLFGYDL